MENGITSIICIVLALYFYGKWHNNCCYAVSSNNVCLCKCVCATVHLFLRACLWVRVYVCVCGGEHTQVCIGARFDCCLSQYWFSKEGERCPLSVTAECWPVDQLDSSWVESVHKRGRECHKHSQPCSVVHMYTARFVQCALCWTQTPIVELLRGQCCDRIWHNISLKWPSRYTRLYHVRFRYFSPN